MPSRCLTSTALVPHMRSKLHLQGLVAWDRSSSRAGRWVAPDLDWPDCVSVCTMVGPAAHAVGLEQSMCWHVGRAAFPSRSMGNLEVLSLGMSLCDVDSGCICYSPHGALLTI